MASTTVVRQDAHSPFIRAGGNIYRPADSTLTPDARLFGAATKATSRICAGQAVQAEPIAGHGVCRVKIGGCTEYWQNHGSFTREQADANGGKIKSSAEVWTPRPE